MNKNRSYTKKDVLEIAEKEKILFVRLQFVDLLGTPKNIVIPVEVLRDALEYGISSDGSSISGFATIEESDKIAKADPSSFVLLPEIIERRKTAKLNCDIYQANGERFIGDSKYVLERILEKAKKMGFIYNTGAECEFFYSKKMAKN